MCSSIDAAEIKRVVAIYVKKMHPFDAYNVWQYLNKEIAYHEVFVEVATLFRKEFGHMGCQWVALSSAIGECDHRQLYVPLFAGKGNRMQQVWSNLKEWLPEHKSIS